jgi:hypothetical protein
MKSACLTQLLPELLAQIWDYVVDERPPTVHAYEELQPEATSIYSREDRAWARDVQGISHNFALEARYRWLAEVSLKGIGEARTLLAHLQEEQAGLTPLPIAHCVRSLRVGSALRADADFTWYVFGETLPALPLLIRLNLYSRLEGLLSLLPRLQTLNLTFTECPFDAEATPIHLPPTVTRVILDLPGASGSTVPVVFCDQAFALSLRARCPHLNLDRVLASFPPLRVLSLHIYDWSPIALWNELEALAGLQELYLRLETRGADELLFFLAMVPLPALRVLHVKLDQCTLLGVDTFFEYLCLRREGWHMLQDVVYQGRMGSYSATDILDALDDGDLPALRSITIIADQSLSVCCPPSQEEYAACEAYGVRLKWGYV